MKAKRTEPVSLEELWEYEAKHPVAFASPCVLVEARLIAEMDKARRPRRNKDMVRRGLPESGVNYAPARPSRKGRTALQSHAANERSSSRWRTSLAELGRHSATNPPFRHVQ